MPDYPTVDADFDVWGDKLVAFEEVEHIMSGTNGGKHKIPKTVQIKVYDDAVVVATGDGQASFFIPPELDGWNLIDADAGITTASSSGLPTIQLRRVRSGTPADMLSTKISIDATELTSWTATSQPAIDNTKDDVVLGDIIWVDVDVAGTGAKGLAVIMRFGMP